MKHKKWLCGVGTLTICFMLTGCCMSHEWKEATCTEPKTCTKCGETEGEALEHTWIDATCAEPKHCSICGETEGEVLAHIWVDATCTEPKHCSVCGKTEGEALEHTLTDANYQQAATCEICGEVVGEPLQADFKKYNFTYVTEIDKEYPFTTKCYDSDDLTNGKVIFSDYQVFESDDEHEAKEGYEWRTVTYTVVFDDENADMYGMNGFGSVSTNFYDCPYSDSEDDENEDEEEEDGDEPFFTVNYNGIDYTECIEESESLENQWLESEDGSTYYEGQIRYYFRVPIGYDGITLAVFNDEIRKELGDTVSSLEQVMLYMEDKNTVTFRLE